MLLGTERGNYLYVLDGGTWNESGGTTDFANRDCKQHPHRIAPSSNRRMTTYNASPNAKVVNVI